MYDDEAGGSGKASSSGKEEPAGEGFSAAIRSQVLRQIQSDIEAGRMLEATGTYTRPDDIGGWYTRPGVFSE